jgi:tRNA(Ile)-lysidine synthetase-like protein
MTFYGIINSGDFMSNIEAILKHLNTLTTKEEPLILALSGGVDSMVLFDILINNNYQVIIAHVNHKQRKESDIEYEAIKTLAHKHNVPFEGYTIDETIESNFQAVARSLRLNFFKEVAKKYNSKKILLAHHLDDQIETFFMKFVKGSPLQNLRSIQLETPLNGITLLRPLIYTPKEVLVDYAFKNKINYYEDYSNYSDTYTRNRFRHQIIPTLVDEKDTFYTMMLERLEQLNAINDLIKEQSLQFIKQHKKRIPIESFLTLNPLVQDDILRRLVNHFTNKTYNLSKQQLDQLIKLLNTYQGNLTYPISNILEFHIEYDHFFIALPSENSQKYIEITQEGTYHYDTQTSYVVTHKKSSQISENYTVLWYNSKVFPIMIRPRNSGDQILCSFGHKKIKDLYIEKKIPPSERKNIPLLVNDKEVLWIPFLKMSKYQKKLKKKVYIYEVRTC